MFYIRIIVSCIFHSYRQSKKILLFHGTFITKSRSITLKRFLINVIEFTLKCCCKTKKHNGIGSLYLLYICKIFWESSALSICRVGRLARRLHDRTTIVAFVELVRSFVVLLSWRVVAPPTLLIASQKILNPPTRGLQMSFRQQFNVMLAPEQCRFDVLAHCLNLTQ